MWKPVIVLPFIFALTGCMEWQSAATAFNKQAVTADDNVRGDEAVALTELQCRLPYATIQNMSKVNPNYPAVIALNCGVLPATPFGVLAPVGLPVISTIQ